MMRNNLMVLSFSLVASLALVPMLACGPDTDDCRVLKVCETGDGGSGEGGGEWTWRCSSRRESAHS